MGRIRSARRSHERSVKGLAILQPLSTGIDFQAANALEIEARQVTGARLPGGSFPRTRGNYLDRAFLSASATPLITSATSSSELRQLQTLTRMARRPYQVVPVKKA